MLPTSEVIPKSTFPTNISLHKWCGCHIVLAPADSLLLFRSKILHLTSSNGVILPGSIDLHKTELVRLSVIKWRNLARQHRLAQNRAWDEITATVNERWEESVSDSLPCKVGKVFDALLKYSIHEENRGGKNKRKQETHLSPIPYICKLKLLSESYVCADLPLQWEIASKPALTAERAWLAWLKSFDSKGQEWSVAPLVLDVTLCSRSTWQGLANSPLAG
uniref:Uncharacterized protein n=1 Tax=Musa balbisiana TaxID=52838 RepID=Q1EP32_MUSBA|nr:hypothetical protein MBP_91N22.42 [Musa balbisiana]